MNWFPAGDAERRPIVLAVLAVAVAAGLRWALWPWISGDYYWGWRLWYEHLVRHGFAGFAQPFHDYNPPWPYIVWLTSLLHGRVDGLLLIKLATMAFDLLLAFAAHRLVRAVHPEGPRPLIAFCAVLLAPTVVMNAGVVVQCDGIYSGFAMLAILAVIRGRSVAAWVAFGVAISFKLQATFIAPFLVAAVLCRRLSPWPAPLVAVIYVLTIVPAWLAGRPFLDLLFGYVSQSGMFVSLSSDAVNLYTLIDSRHYTFGYGFGLILATIVALAYVRVIQTARRPLDAETLLHAAAVAAALCPFVLPKMHDRYFLMSDVLTIALAVANPAYALVAAAQQTASALAYLPWNMGFGGVLVPGVLINAVAVPWLAGRLVFRLHPGAAPALEPLFTQAALARALAALVPAYAAWSFGLGLFAAAGRDVTAWFGNVPVDLAGLAAFVALWASVAIAIDRARRAIACPSPAIGGAT